MAKEYSIGKCWGEEVVKGLIKGTVVHGLYR